MFRCLIFALGVCNPSFRKAVNQVRSGGGGGIEVHVEDSDDE
jgi:hypothetical protein